MAVAMGGIDDDGVHTRTHQQFHALFGALAHAHCSAHAQLAMGIARSIGEAGLLGDVFDGDQALELKSIVDNQQTLEFVLVQQGLAFSSVVPSGTVTSFSRGVMIWLTGMS